MRGGVFDFFPPGEPRPIRLDLFGDTVESIQRFEPESQRSIEHLDAVRMLPLGLFPEGPEESELLAELLGEMIGPSPSQEVAERLGQLRNKGGFDGWQQLLPLLARETSGLVDLVRGARAVRPLVVALDRETLVAEAREHWQLLTAEFESRREEARLAVAPELLEHPLADVLSALEGADLRLGDTFDDLADQRSTVDFAATLTDRMHDQLPRLAREVELAYSRGERVLLVAPADHRARLAELLETLEVAQGQGGAELVAGDLGRGFRLPPAGVVVFGERAKILATNSGQRSALAPNIPAIAEIVPGFDFAVTVGALGASGIPPYAVKRMSEEIAKAVKDPAVVKQFNTLGIESVGGTPEAYRDAIEAEGKRYESAIKDAGIKAN